MRYVWTCWRPSAQTLERIELVEEYGLCQTNYELRGGWQCQGNGMMTVLRQLLNEGWTLSAVREEGR